MRHITFDLETLGTGPKSPIVQLAAVEFNPADGSVLKVFNWHIDLGEDFHKFDSDISTIEFWISQNKTAQGLVFPKENRKSLFDVLVRFDHWLSEMGDKKKLWSHATFDPPILMNAYKVAGIKKTQAHYKEFMDIRTINFLGGEVETKPRATFGEHHDAIADCKFQADYISALMRKLGAHEA